MLQFPCKIPCWLPRVYSVMRRWTTAASLHRLPLRWKVCTFLMWDFLFNLQIIYLICNLRHEATYLLSLELSSIEEYLGEYDSLILLIYKYCFFIFLVYIMLHPIFLSVLCSVYVGVLNYFMCSVWAYVKPFFDCDLIDFVTFCLWKHKYPLIQWLSFRIRYLFLSFLFT